MGKRLLLVFVVGFILLSFFPSPIARALSMFLFALLVGYCLISLVLHFALHAKKEKEDLEGSAAMLGDPEGKRPQGKTFFDLTEYSRELRRKYRSREAEREKRSRRRAA